MKARIKKTGEIVNLASYATITLDMCDSWGNPIELKPEEIELIQDKTDDFDWQSFRAEAAKDILCAIISCPIIKHLKDGEGNLIPFEKCAATNVAIEYADKLIKQLKEKEETKLTWKEVKYIIELDGNIETDNFMGSDEYYQAIADKANVVLFGLQGKLD